MQEISVAIVGAGGMAREHARAFAALPGVRVTGIHSRTRSRAETLARELGIPQVCDDIASLRVRSAADLVVVAVPELQANAVAKACFAHDWAVLLEKPAGYDLADAEDIAAAAEKSGQKVMVAFNRRFYASTMAVRADIDSRPEKRFIRVQDQQNVQEARSHGHPEAVVEKFMYANSVHVIDLIMAFARGEPVEVKRIMPWQGGSNTDVMLAHILFDSGDAAIYEGIWRGPGPWACAVSTPGRRWMMQPLEQAAFQNAGERRQNLLEPDKADTGFKAGFLRQAEAVVARVRGETSNAVDIPESLRTMRLINRMFGV